MIGTIRSKFSRIIKKGIRFCRSALRFLKRGCHFLWGKMVSPFRKLRIRLGSKHISLDVGEVFLQQNTAEGFNRYDTIVRYLAIENYYGKNDYGFELYKKMQEKRCRDDSELRLETFKKLIKSYEEKGYNSASEIELNSDLTLLDGSHRLAMAIYRGEKAISCRVLPYTHPVEYGSGWFLENGFTLDMVELIKKKTEETIQKYSAGGVLALLFGRLPIVMYKRLRIKSVSFTL